MELDDLKKVWRNEMNSVSQLKDLQFTAIKEKVSRIHFGIKLRDSLDIGGCVIAVAALLFFLLSSSGFNLLLLVTTLFLIVICSFYPFVVFRFRKNDIHNSWKLSARLAAEISKLEREQRFIFIADIWYGRPMMLGLLLFVCGMHDYKIGGYVPSGMYLLLIIICFIAYALAIIWLRTFWLERKIKPTLKQLRSLRSELSEDNNV